MPRENLPDRCPFCGGLAIVQVAGNGRKKLFYAICQKCLCRTRGVTSQAEAKDLWATRP